jgi:CHAD domain-containing protein
LPEKKAVTWLNQIRNVTRALGEARDTDVQLERLEMFYQTLLEEHYRPGIRRLMLRLRQKRHKLQKPVVNAMGELIESGMIQQMYSRLSAQASKAEQVYIYTPVLYRHSFNSISSRLEEFLAYDEIVLQPEKVTELHAMRISAKQLRYTMENFAALYPDELKPFLSAVKNAQELLGDIHDCDVWTAFLPQFLAEEHQRTLEYFGIARPFKRLEPGITFFAEERLQTRTRLYEAFVSSWQGWKQEELWAELQRTIQIPSPKTPLAPKI